LAWEAISARIKLDTISSHLVSGDSQSSLQYLNRAPKNTACLSHIWPSALLTIHDAASQQELTHSLNKSQTIRSRVLLEKLIIALLVNILHDVYEILKFIEVFTTARHWSLF
jgi:hypothetical protein